MSSYHENKGPMKSDQNVQMMMRSQNEVQDMQRIEPSHLSRVRCRKGNQCINLCASEACDKNAAICGDLRCVCRSDHRKGKICQKVELEDLVLLTEAKKKCSHKLQKQINDKFFKLVRQISKEREKILEKTKTAGLQDFQVSFLKAVNKGSELKGPLISKVVKNLKQSDDSILKEKKRNGQKPLIDIMSSSMIQIRKKITTLRQHFNNVLNAFEIESHKNILESKVAETESEKLIVNEMLNCSGRKVANYMLLYRASENNFEVSKFWQKCDHKTNTVTLIRTDFNKAIGGYTPISWKKEMNWNHQQDPTLTSFLFSITEITKFDINEQKRQYSIYHRADYGPYFGGGCDIAISDKANVNNSWANFGYTYQNKNVPCNSKEGWQLFQGSTNSSHFKIKQWEVWQVIFE